MKKKLLSLALALALCMGLTTPALAAFDPGIAKKPTVLSLGDCTIAVIDENDTLWMWGSPYYGMLGNNGVTDDHQKIYAQETRIKVMENVRSVAISGSMVFPFAAAVKTDGSLWTWGSNMTGQLGNGGVGEIYKEWTAKPSVYKAVPVKIMDDVVAVSCGEGYAAAIKTDGSLWTWGDNKWGQLGDGTLEERKTPVKVMDQVSIVTCGMTNTAAVKEDGSLWMWGNTTGNALNNGGKGNTIKASDGYSAQVQTVPLKIMDDVKCAYFTETSTPPLVLKTDGTLVTWPENAGYLDDYVDPVTGLLMPGGPIKPTEPMPLITIGTKVESVSTGCGPIHTGGDTVAIQENFAVKMYGNNIYGQLGAHFESQYVSRENPVLLTLFGPAAIAVHYQIGVAVTDKGELVGWGAEDDSRIAVTPPNTKRRTDIRRTHDFAGNPCNIVCVTSPAPIQDTALRVKIPTDERIPVSTVGGFTDVKSTDYFANAVLWAVLQNITSGTSKTTFSPGATCNRAQILSFLWRASGSPEPTAANPFSDIKSTDYFYKAALWAAEKGMVSGSAFGASTPCTRASTMEYMWKAAGSPAASYNGKFDDVPASADYAQAVAWALENGVTSGTSKTTFAPDSTCTRGQIVAFLYRAMGN